MACGLSGAAQLPPPITATLRLEAPLLDRYVNGARPENRLSNIHLGSKTKHCLAWPTRRPDLLSPRYGSRTWGREVLRGSPTHQLGKGVARLRPRRRRVQKNVLASGVANSVALGLAGRRNGVRLTLWRSEVSRLSVRGHREEQVSRSNGREIVARQYRVRAKIIDVGAAAGQSTDDARRLPDGRCGTVSLVGGELPIVPQRRLNEPRDCGDSARAPNPDCLTGFSRGRGHACVQSVDILRVRPWFEPASHTGHAAIGV